MRAEAGKEAVKQLVPVLDLFEELEAKYADVADEASLKVLGGYRNLQAVFFGKADRLGLKPVPIGACCWRVEWCMGGGGGGGTTGGRATMT